MGFFFFSSFQVVVPLAQCLHRKRRSWELWLPLLTSTPLWRAPWLRPSTAATIWKRPSPVCCSEARGRGGAVRFDHSTDECATCPHTCSISYFFPVFFRLPDGLTRRGDINLLMLGDPGTAKSQLLKFVERCSPIGVDTHSPWLMEVLLQSLF